ncbi:MAG: helix-turn-helix transcriptional regulator [Lachnospiraceae bacterium]|nr:helix-turn-helix transcriptional regulator [Lachnospiraceae bacterium]
MEKGNQWENSQLFILDKEMLHRSQNDELLFYRQVASGDMEAIEENCRQHRFLETEGVGTLSKDPVLNLKYHFIVTAALVSRICTEQGMEMEQSFRLSDYYISHLDRLSTQQSIEAWHNKMVLDYTSRMHLLRQNAALSRPITECLNYIYAHIKERITIEDLAQHTEKSASYISRLFKSELGMPVSDYIRHIKIDKAKNLLRFSNFTMVEISSYLSFSSQSHFIKIFQEECGMTPKKYRDAYYGTHWKGPES